MIIQLHPDMPGHWGLFGRFEQRCVEFGARDGWPISDVLKTEMRVRFAQSPQFAGYFLNDELTAHVLSWVLVNHGQVGIVIWQCEGAPGSVAPLLHNFFETVLPRWMDRIEMAVKKPVEFVELGIRSEREPQWIRLLEGYRKVTVQRPMTVLRLQPLRSVMDVHANGASK